MAQVQSLPFGTWALGGFLLSSGYRGVRWPGPDLLVWHLDRSRNYALCYLRATEFLRVSHQQADLDSGSWRRRMLGKGLISNAVH